MTLRLKCACKRVRARGLMGSSVSKIHITRRGERDLNRGHWAPSRAEHLVVLGVPITSFGAFRGGTTSSLLQTPQTLSLKNSIS